MLIMFESLKRLSFGALIVSCVLVVVYLFGSFRHFIETQFNNGKEFFLIYLWLDRPYKPDIDYSFFNTFFDGVFTIITIAFGLFVMCLIIREFYLIGDDFLKKRGDGDTQESITPISFMILMTAIVLGVWVAQLVYLALR